MRKLRQVALLLLLIVFTSMVARAETAKVYDWPVMSATGFTTNLNLVNNVNGQYLVSSYNTLSVSLGTGTNSACTWQLQASDDIGTTWYNVLTAQSCTGPNFLQVANLPLRMLRVQVVTYTGTAALTFHWTGGD